MARYGSYKFNFSCEKLVKISYKFNKTKFSLRAIKTYSIVNNK